MGRFEVARAFTKAGIKMDFRFASRLLYYATNKGKAYLIVEGGQGNDDAFGSEEAYKKYKYKVRDELMKRAKININQ